MLVEGVDAEAQLAEDLLGRAVASRHGDAAHSECCGRRDLRVLELSRRRPT
jgi:hypothetical protein